jgi:MoxR-like ATPase
MKESMTLTTPVDNKSGAEPPSVEAVSSLARRRETLTEELGRVIVGQRAVIENVLLTVFCGGHALIVGVPGLAKTLLVRSLGEALDLKFSRIQFTPDLMPTDITGTEVLEEDRSTGKRMFRFVRGPIFANVVLADEINRTPPKTQAALLQAMQERAVTAAGETMKLDRPFFVLATQNPIEQEGTYPLPEAQLDRFMLKVKVGYPSREDEVRIIDRMAGAGAEPSASKVMTTDEVLAARDVVRQIFVDDKVKRYAVDLVAATRDPKGSSLPQLAPLIDNGASVRASIALVKVAKAQALLSGRSYISPHDVKTIAHDVLRHRILVSYEAEAQGKTTDHVIAQILENVPVP